MNSVALTGRLGKDPELRYFETGSVATNFTVAVKGIKKDETVWLDVKAWGKTAELIGEYFKKGSQIGIVGRLQQETWEKDGQKRSKIIIVADSVDFLDKKED